MYFEYILIFIFRLFDKKIAQATMIRKNSK